MKSYFPLFLELLRGTQQEYASKMVVLMVCDLVD
jgi:hypothetical protein